MTRGPADGYAEGERVFGPPYGSFDADWVVRAALAQEPTLAPDEASALTTTAWTVLREIGEPDEVQLAHRLAVGDIPDVHAAAVAAAAVDFVRAYRVPLD